MQKPLLWREANSRERDGSGLACLLSPSWPHVSQCQQEFVLQTSLWQQVEAQLPFREGGKINRGHRLWNVA